jgi:phage terminase large subunit-like protein
MERINEEELAGWILIRERIRENPNLLPHIRKTNPRLFARIIRGVRRLAISISRDAWRDPRPGHGARPEQLIPGTPGSFSDRTDWLLWLLCGGRGSGKSHAGAEGTRELIQGRRWGERPRWALVGQTLESVRTDMVENTLLPILPSGSVIKWNRGPCELWIHTPTQPAFLKGFTSEAPRKLRGPNFHGAWVDEIATLKDANKSPSADGTFSNLKLATRAHDGHTWIPRIIGTTTPKPVPLLRNPDPSNILSPGLGLYDDPTTVVSHMSTMANRANLADAYFETVVKPLIGTRLYEQEVEGKMMNVALGAQWSYELVERMKFGPNAELIEGGGLKRVIVAVDPSVGAGLGAECGIVVAGLGWDDRVYVLADLSFRAPAREWIKVVISAYYQYQAEAIVVETNQGGELFQEVMGRTRALPLIEVFGKRGKMLRAEPVALLSDVDRVRFVESPGSDFEMLWNQMKTWDGEDDSPDRLDAFVYAVLALLPKETNAGTLINIKRGFGSR